MTERGFSPGQGNDYAAPANIIFRAALDDFERRWPALFERLNARYGNDLALRDTILPPTTDA